MIRSVTRTFQSRRYLSGHDYFGLFDLVGRKQTVCRMCSICSHFLNADNPLITFETFGYTDTAAPLVFLSENASALPVSPAPPLLSSICPCQLTDRLAPDKLY
jgi:hypothetical protein